MMRGLILAGGHGTRLHPTTQVVNKHLLNIYDKPMIFYPIEALRDAGIRDIVITVGDHDPERFFDLIGDGKELGVKIDYHFHGAPKGIAYAINEARELMRDEPFVVHLGDNIFCEDISPAVNVFRKTLLPLIVCKSMNKRQVKNYGVPRFKDTRVVEVLEKPSIPPSNYAVLGLYFLTSRFFNIYEDLKPSARGEYEITDALTRLVPDLCWIKYDGGWFDCGTFEDIFQATKWRRQRVLKSRTTAQP